MEFICFTEKSRFQSIKITARGLEDVVGGTELYVVGQDDYVDEIKAALMADMQSLLNRFDTGDKGVHVQASSLSTLDAVLETLASPASNLNVSSIAIGPVDKKDIEAAARARFKLEKEEVAIILAFDVVIMSQARELAENFGVQIFCSDYINQILSQLCCYTRKLKEKALKEAVGDAVFPCVLRPNHVLFEKDPCRLGVEVDVCDGIVKIGTPLCIPRERFIAIGRIKSIVVNKREVEGAKKGQKKVVIEKVDVPSEVLPSVKSLLVRKNELISLITDHSADALVVNCKDLSRAELILLAHLKDLCQYGPYQA